MEQIGNVIKAIETKYHGYSFRSRLEARWAVFFEQIGVKFEYEPEGFDFSDVPHIDAYLDPSDRYYLPDFWLPTLKCYVEIKPMLTPVDDAAVTKAFLLSKRAEVLIIYGQPGTNSYRVISCRTGKEMPAFWKPISQLNRAYAVARSARF